MSNDLDLEQRYRRLLRLLPGYYRDAWEQDMVTAFLDSWLTGDPDEDSVIMEFDRPGWQEAASVAGLAARLYLGGAGAPRRYFAWGQAVRGAVLAVLLVHAAAGLDGLVSAFLPGSRDWIVVPTPPATLAAAPGGAWPPTVWYMTGYVWIVIFVALVLGYYRAARVIAALAIVPALVWLVQAQLAGSLLSPFGSWAFWVLIDLAPVLAMAAFHRDAPPAARRRWLLALPAYCLLVSVPLLAVELTGHSAWVPDTPGLCCVLVAFLCLAHTPRAWSSQAVPGVWSLTLVLLTALAAAYRIVSLGDYLQDPHLTYYLQGPHLISVGLAELLVLVAAAVLVAPDAARAQTGRASTAVLYADGLPHQGRRMRGSGRRPAGAGIAVAAVALTCAGCSQVLPLGPAPPASRHLASAIILQLVLSQPPSPTGGCPSGYTTLAAPFPDFPEVPPACYRKLGKPVTFASAAVTMAYQPAANQQPATYGVNFTLPAAGTAALTAITTKAFASRDQLAVSTAGKTWNVTMTAGPSTNGQFGILVQSKAQAVQLQRILITSA
jgi:hypothetical protein